jgi:hypothetical protein
MTPINMENNNPPTTTCHEISDGHPAKMDTILAATAPIIIPMIPPINVNVTDSELC